MTSTINIQEDIFHPQASPGFLLQCATHPDQMVRMCVLATPTASDEAVSLVMAASRNNRYFFPVYKAAEIELERRSRDNENKYLLAEAKELSVLLGGLHKEEETILGSLIAKIKGNKNKELSNKLEEAQEIVTTKQNTATP